jgi:hypothetical protein
MAKKKTGSEVGQTTVLSIQTYKNWDASDWKRYFNRRLQNMRAKRKDIEAEWTLADEQVKAESFYDTYGQLNVNVKHEAVLGEIYMGRTEGKINYDILPDEQADIEELQPTKYALQFFLDGNEKDNFWKENRLFRSYKWHYGTGIFFTGMRSYKDIRFTIKKDIIPTGEGDLYNEDNFDETTFETWFFHPQAIHPRDFYIDDAAYGQPDVQYAQDCIRKEKVSRVDFEMRYLGNPAFDQEAVKKILAWWGGLDIYPKNENDRSIDQNEFIIYHYYHRVTKKYIINVDEREIIFNGRYLYNDGKLPFESAQHYSKNDRFWGEGIPARMGWNKAFRSEIWQDILAGSQMNSGINLIVGNEEQIGQDWWVGWRWLNLWRTTWWAEWVQPIQTKIDLWFYSAILDKLDQQSAVDSGINSLEQFDPGSDKVGIVEIMEANKSVRNRSVDENYNICLDGTLTQTISRIKQFAPSLLAERKMSEDGKTVLKYIFPMIRIQGYEVKKDGKKQVFVESAGKYGYFELKSETIKGIGVKVTTPSTNSLLPILERQKVTEYITNIQNLTMAFQAMPEALGKLQEKVNIEELFAWMSDAYGYDQNGLKAKTEKDKISEEIAKKFESLKNALSINQPTDENLSVTPDQAPGIPNQQAPDAQSTGWAMWPALWGESGAPVGPADQWNPLDLTKA